MIPIATPRGASVERSAIHLIDSSSALGTTIKTMAPTAGIRTVSVSAHESNQFIRTIPLRLREDPQREGEEPNREDQDQGVELQSTGLNLAQLAAGVAGDVRKPVDHAVDTAL